jgi:hypothetical protein
VRFKAETDDVTARCLNLPTKAMSSRGGRYEEFKRARAKGKAFRTPHTIIVVIARHDVLQSAPTFAKM